MRGREDTCRGRERGGDGECGEVRLRTFLFCDSHCTSVLRENRSIEVKGREEMFKFNHC